MENNINFILTRGSIRNYRKDAVPQNMVEDMLRAAMSAPSAGNQRPWHFVVVDDRALLDEISKFHSGMQMLSRAPLAIVVCGKKELFKMEMYWPQDCSAASQNILLSANALGLGAVWIGFYPVEENMSRLSEALRLPGDLVPFSLIPVGFPAEEKELKNRFEESRIHYNAF